MAYGSVEGEMEQARYDTLTGNEINPQGRRQLQEKSVSILSNLHIKNNSQ